MLVSQLPLYDRAVSLCRQGGFADILLRGDTDFSLTEHFAHWDEAGVRFVFGYDAKANLVEEAGGMAERCHRELVARAEAAAPPQRRRPYEASGANARRPPFPVGSLRVGWEVRASSTEVPARMLSVGEGFGWVPQPMMAATGCGLFTFVAGSAYLGHC